MLSPERRNSSFLSDLSQGLLFPLLHPPTLMYSSSSVISLSPIFWFFSSFYGLLFALLEVRFIEIPPPPPPMHPSSALTNLRSSIHQSLPPTHHCGVSRLHAPPTLLVSYSKSPLLQLFKLSYVKLFWCTIILRSKFGPQKNLILMFFYHITLKRVSSFAIYLSLSLPNFLRSQIGYHLLAPITSIKGRYNQLCQ